MKQMNADMLSTEEWIEKRQKVEKVLLERSVYIEELEYREVGICLLAGQILSELGFKAMSSNSKRRIK